MALTFDTQSGKIELFSEALAKMRTLVDTHPAEYWEGNLYNLWVGALRTLSPASEAADPTAVGLPALAGTQAWGRRLLNAQLLAVLSACALADPSNAERVARARCVWPDHRAR